MTAPASEERRLCGIESFEAFWRSGGSASTPLACSFCSLGFCLHHSGQGNALYKAGRYKEAVQAGKWSVAFVVDSHLLKHHANISYIKYIIVYYSI